MSPDWIIGVLAFVTLGLIAALAVYHFGTFLKDPRNRGHAHNALIADGKAASTKVQEGEGPQSHAGRTLKDRLDDSPASQHPDDPQIKKSAA